MFTLELNNKTYKSSTLSRIGVEGYSTPVRKRDKQDPARSALLCAKAKRQLQVSNLERKLPSSEAPQLS